MIPPSLREDNPYGLYPISTCRKRKHFNWHMNYMNLVNLWVIFIRM